MARQPRIQFPNALYHVMARGNQRSEIFVDDEDREQFLDTLDETCQRTGFEVLAWVMMSNHYHLAIRTPEANLVEGMKWFQNTYTRRFNRRHRSWGRLFGDRYKAVLVQQSSRDDLSYAPAYDRVASRDETAHYLRKLIDYIHLNPARANLVQLTKSRRTSKNDPAPLGLLSYPWSSLAKGYGIAPSKRPSWMNVNEGLSRVELEDTVAGRRRYIERLEKMEIDRQKGAGDPETETLDQSILKGWYWGTQSFADQLREQFLNDQSSGENRTTNGNRNYRTSMMARDHSESRAREIIREGEQFFGIEDGVASLGRGDDRRVAIAWTIWRTTSVPQKWIAEELNWTTAANVSNQVRKLHRQKRTSLRKALRAWMRKCE